MSYEEEALMTCITVDRSVIGLLLKALIEERGERPLTIEQNELAKMAEKQILIIKTLQEQVYVKRP